MQGAFALVTIDSGRLMRCRVCGDRVQVPWADGLYAQACPEGVTLSSPGRAGQLLRPGRSAEVGGRITSCLTASREPDGTEAFELGSDLIACSESMLKVFHMVACVAPLPDPVTLLGESGSGKELIAKAIHELGRPSRPFVAINLAAVPIELVEAELFGWTRGSFTGATDSRPGAFESAASGTLFLDEVTEAPLSVQVKLLRAVETGTVQRIGANRILEPGFRVVAASNRDLARAVSTGQFRLDLAERLACLVIRVPPLRSRLQDLPVLARRLCTCMPGAPRLDRDALEILLAHDWPGNVRELRNVLRRASVLSGRGILNAEAIRDAIASGRMLAAGCAEQVATTWERRTRAAEIAASGLPRSTYYYRLKRGRIPVAGIQ